MSSDDSPNDLRPVRIVFRSSPSAAAVDVTEAVYQATPETIEQLTSDFTRNKAAGAYSVYLPSREPRTLALRFADVLYIG